MTQELDTLFSIIFPLTLILIAFLSGKIVESMHYRRIKKREADYLKIPTISTQNLGSPGEIQRVLLVSGSVVISIDYFKRLLAILRSLFGGEISAYSSLIDRGRREAVLRMKEACPEADQFLNVRIETATIAKNPGGTHNGVAGMEFMAFATAVILKK